MITLSWYLLKVIICSGILYGYYFLALRNKAFHRWNRFFLLASIALALVAPLIKINIFQQPVADRGAVIKMLQTINYGDEVVIEINRSRGFHINMQNLAGATYLLGSLIFLSIFFIALYKINKLRKRNPKTQIEDISFITTNEKGTPFSFFNSIFWNNAIDLHSRPGQQIFNHEIAHVKEKHSYDKMFMNMIMIFFWVNPFFWLMQKELFMIHEFIADEEAMEDQDISAFAEMILQTVYPGQNFSLTNNFFYSPIKRRLMMLTKNKNPKINYLSRLLVLPLAAIVFFAFTLKIKSLKSTSVYDGKTITVVIDAGHGGQDNGAISNGQEEKNITLSIAKKIAGLNTDPKIKILLSREGDETIPVRDRVAFAKTNDANLFISIHLNSSTNEQLNGFSVLTDKNNSEPNLLLSSAIINEIKKSYKTEYTIGLRNIGIFVLDANVCPAALVQCGFISNKKDAAFITNVSNQEKIAQDILNAITVFANNQTGAPTAIHLVKCDTIPRMYYKGKKVTGLKVFEYRDSVVATYSDGTKETITKEEAKKRGFILPPPPPPPLPPLPPPPPPRPTQPTTYNGKKIKNVEGLSTNRKATIHYTDGSQETISEQEARKAGFMLFTPPKKVTPPKNGNANQRTTENVSLGSIPIGALLQKDTQYVANGTKVPMQTTNPIFTHVEHEANFPGGKDAWIKYISKKIMENQGQFTEKDFGKCILKFIVSKDGNISDVEATTMKGSKLAEIAINAVKNGPKWNPAMQNGRKVNSVRLQPVTLSNPG